MLTSPGRLALPLLPLAVAAAVLGGCTDDPAPGPSGSVAGPTTTASVAPSAGETSSETTVGEVYRAARTASLSAASGHAVGTVTSEGRELGLDLEGVADGSNQTVFLTTPKGGTAEVLTVGDQYWVGGDQAHWAEITGDPATAKTLVGRYAPISEGDATELGSFTLRSILTDAFSWPDLTVLESDTGAAARTDLDGTPAYVLGAEGGARLWVAADGSGTLLRLVGPKTQPTDLTFSQWGKADTFTAPPPEKLIEN